MALAGVAVLTLAACGSSDTACGWDLSTQAGRDANAARLDEVTQWMSGHPGMPAPAPTSTFWHGECPSTGTPGPPVGEHEDG